MKVKIYCGWKQEEWQCEPVLNISHVNYVSEDKGYMNVMTTEVEIDVTPPTHEQAVNSVIKVLRKEQGELIAKSNAIESRIQELLCIEHKEVA